MLRARGALPNTACACPRRLGDSIALFLRLTGAMLSESLKPERMLEGLYKGSPPS